MTRPICHDCDLHHAVACLELIKTFASLAFVCRCACHFSHSSAGKQPTGGTRLTKR